MLQSLIDAREAAAHAVWQSGTIGIDLENGFRMKIHDKYPDAPPSPIYVSLRPRGVKGGQLEAEHLTCIGDAMAQFAITNGVLSQPRWIGGIPAAGEPILDAIFEVLESERRHQLRRFFLCKEENEIGRRIAGLNYQHNIPTDTTNPVVLVDDLMTNLATKQEAIAALSAASIPVDTLLLFLDRSSGGAAKLANEDDVVTHAVWQFDQFLEFGLAYGYLSRTQFDQVITYPETLAEYLKHSSM